MRRGRATGRGGRGKGIHSSIYLTLPGRDSAGVWKQVRYRCRQHLSSVLDSVNKNTDRTEGAPKEEEEVTSSRKEPVISKASHKR